MPDTGTALINRYDKFKVGRVGMLGGVRRVTFRTVNGFDALVGSQDVMNGASVAQFRRDLDCCEPALDSRCLDQCEHGAFPRLRRR